MTAHGFAWATWLAGCVVVLSVAVSCGLVGRALQRRLVPGWDAAAAACMAAGLGFAWFVLVVEGLGLADALTRPGLAIGFPVASVALAGIGRLHRPAAATAAVAVPAAASARRPLRPQELLVVAGLLVLAAAPWFAGTVTSWHIGIADVDSHYYHLAHAVRIAQSGSLRSIPLLSPGDGVDYYPLDAELLHAVGMVAFRSDVASLVVNDAALVLLLGCGWALARVRGLAAVTALADLPVLTRFEPGVGKNDVVVLAAFALVAVAVQRLPAGPGIGGHVALGVGLGLAAGTKLSALVPVAVLAACVIGLARGRRAQVALAVVVPALVVGGFFYARALTATGSPVPSLSLPGLPGPPLPLVHQLSASILDAARAPHAWSTVFRPGLRLGLGPVWPVALIGWLTGCTVTLRPGAGRTARIFGLGAALSLLVYLVQPGSAPGLLGTHLLFGGNLRLITPSLLLALLALATDRGLPAAVTTVLAAVLIAGSLSDTSVVWQQRPAVRAVAPVLMLVVAGAWLTAACVGGSAPDARVTAASVAVLVVAVIVGGGPVVRSYLRQRYTPPANDALALFGWSDSVHGQRIAVVGYPQTFGYEGADLSNTVRYLGRPTAHHGMLDFTSCTGWRQALADGGFGYVVIRQFGDLPEPDARAWTRSLPGAQVVLSNSAGEVIRLTRRPGPVGCTAA